MPGQLRSWREGQEMAKAPARLWLAAAVLVALLVAVAAWSVRSGQPEGSVSAGVVDAVPQQAVASPEVAAKSSPGSEPNTQRAAAADDSTAKAVEEPEVASKAPDVSAGDVAPDSAMKPGSGELDLRGGLRIGGHARLVDSFIGVVDVDESDVAKTINVHILQDEDFNYYFDLDSQTVPAGEKVMFVVNNTHFTPDECW